MTTPEREDPQRTERNREATLVRTEQHKRRRGRWLLWLMVLMFLGMAAFTVRWWQYGLRSNARSAAYKASQPYPGLVIGDLGGMRVKVPDHMAELPEYDGDPGWEPAPDWLPPVRTFDSKINSFGFYVRFPDGATLDSRERREEKRLTPPWEDRWISAGVASSTRYPQDGFLDTYVQRRLLNHAGKSVLNRFYRQPQDEHGLEVYRLTPPPGGPDPAKTRVTEEFVGRGAAGEVISTFHCTVSLDENRSRCSQVWSMETQGLRIKLTASYRRPLLQHWREIQPMLTQIVLGFRHDSSQPEAKPSAPR